MLNDQVSLVWINFLESQMKFRFISMKEIHRGSISGSEAAVELDIFSKILKGEMKISVPQNLSLLSDVEDV
jgi:hypothetical protein